MGLIKATHLHGCFNVKIYEILFAQPLAQSWHSFNTNSGVILWVLHYVPALYADTDLTTSWAPLPVPFGVILDSFPDGSVGNKSTCQYKRQRRCK